MKAQAINNWWTTALNIVVLGIAVATLSACGGGGGGTTSSGSTTGVTSGEIESFGSIVVNGVKFEVEGAEVEFEHGQTVIISEATQTEHLNEGMQVEVEVEFNDDGQTGTATRIIVDDELEGEVQGLDASNLLTTGVVTFTVLGQTVVAIDGVTNIDDTQWGGDLANVANGDFVEVHGLPDGNGTIQATLLEFKAATVDDFIALGDEGEFEVTGEITTTPTGTQFNIGADLLVDYTNATPDGPLAIGTLVEVKGTLDTSTTPDTLNATRVHVEDGFDDQAKIEVEGLIRNLDDPNTGEFTLKGQLVDYSGALFFGGVEADLANGIKVEAEGPVIGGVLLANKIKFKDSFRYEGAATEIDANTLNISVPSGATLVVLVDPAITDEEAGINFATNDVKIRARIMSGSTLIATRIDDRGGQGTRQIFEAPVVDFDQATETVELLDDGTDTQQGLIVFDTSGLLDLNQQGGVDSDFEIEDSDVTRSTFYNSLNVGDHVKARYDNNVEDQIEIELED